MTYIVKNGPDKGAIAQSTGALNEWFGLTYANYQVVADATLQEAAPHVRQAFLEGVAQLDYAYRDSPRPRNYRALPIGAQGRFVSNQHSLAAGQAGPTFSTRNPWTGRSVSASASPDAQQRWGEGFHARGYFVLPRSLLQSMTAPWQEKFVQVLERVMENSTESRAVEAYNIVAQGEDGKRMRDPVPHYNRTRTYVRPAEDTPGLRDDLRAFPGDLAAKSASSGLGL